MSDEKRLLSLLRAIADYQFGGGVGERLFPEDCTIELSKRTKRPRHIFLKGVLLATVRPDGMLALTLEGAKRLSQIVERPRFRVTVHPRAAERIREGGDLRCRDVYSVDERLLPGEEVMIEDLNGNLLAVGKAVVAASTMLSLSRGTAVRVRKAVGKE